MPYPWDEGDTLTYTDLNEVIASTRAIAEQGLALGVNNQAGVQSAAGSAALAQTAATASAASAALAASLNLTGLSNALALASGTTTGRSLAARFSDILNLKDFGAVGDGVTDDTAAVQAWITACSAGHVIGIAPPAIYLVSATVTGSGPVTLQGAGSGGGPGLVDSHGTIFLRKASFRSGDVFAITTLYPVVVRDIQFAGVLGAGFTTGTTCTSGAGIHISGPNPGTNSSSRIQNCAFSSLFRGAQFTLCVDHTVQDCYFQAWANAAIYSDNAGVTESGLGRIQFNKFFGDPTPSTGQGFGVWTSVGYGSVTDNLFVGSQIAVAMSVSQWNVGSLVIARNNIEEQTLAGITIAQSGGFSIDAIEIAENEFSNLTNAAIPYHIYVSGATQASIKMLSIVGNKFQSFLSAAGICINVQCATTASIARNLFNISGAYGIAVGSGVVGCDVLDNQIRGSGLLGNAGYFAGTNVVLRDTSSLNGLTFATLPSCGNGSELWVSDAGAAGSGLPLAAGGAGCKANRVSGGWFAGVIPPALPTTVTAASYTVAALDAALVLNPSGAQTLTLPSAAAFPGRKLTLKLISAFAVTSASANVVPLASGTAGTAILSATAGKWCQLKSDGAAWQIMAGN